MGLSDWAKLEFHPTGEGYIECVRTDLRDGTEVFFRYPVFMQRSGQWFAPAGLTWEQRKEYDLALELEFENG